MSSLAKEMVTKAITNAVSDILDGSDLDYSYIIKHDGIAIADEIHRILCKYGLDTEHCFDYEIDFKAIEEIVAVYEAHGYSGGTIHDF